MPLVTCPDCGTSISDAAPSCIRCGRPMSAAPRSAPAADPPPSAPPPPSSPPPQAPPSATSNAAPDAAAEPDYVMSAHEASALGGTARLVAILTILFAPLLGIVASRLLLAIEVDGETLATTFALKLIEAGVLNETIVALIVVLPVVIIATLILRSIAQGFGTSVLQNRSDSHNWSRYLANGSADEGTRLREENHIRSIAVPTARPATLSLALGNGRLGVSMTIPGGIMFVLVFVWAAILGSMK